MQLCTEFGLLLPKLLLCGSLFRSEPRCSPHGDNWRNASQVSHGLGTFHVSLKFRDRRFFLSPGDVAVDGRIGLTELVLVPGGKLTQDVWPECVFDLISSSLDVGREVTAVLLDAEGLVTLVSGDSFGTCFFFLRYRTFLALGPCRSLGDLCHHVVELFDRALVDPQRGEQCRSRLLDRPLE